MTHPCRPIRTRITRSEDAVPAAIEADALVPPTRCRYECAQPIDSLLLPVDTSFTSVRDRTT